VLDPPVRGYLHSPANVNHHALILTHGAGGNSNAPLLVALAETFCAQGYTVLRCDLPFRQVRRFGPPFPGQAERDRAGLGNAVAAMRKQVTGKVYLGGHSYGGRQATILCASISQAGEPALVSGLLLLSYPLHPPRKPRVPSEPGFGSVGWKPEQMRTQHLPHLRTPSLFVHGTRDPFASIDEMKQALEMIPARTELLAIEGTGHDLGVSAKSKKAPVIAGSDHPDLITETTTHFANFFG